LVRGSSQARTGEAVAPQTIAAVFAQAAGIKPPKMAAYPTPEGLFSDLSS